MDMGYGVDLMEGLVDGPAELDSDVPPKRLLVSIWNKITRVCANPVRRISRLSASPGYAGDSMGSNPHPLP